MYEDRATKYIDGAEEMPRESQVSKELDELNSMIFTCGDMVDALGGRLESVLRAKPVAKEPADAPRAVPERVPLAALIEEMRFKVHKTTEILGSIMDRLEL